MRPRENNAVDGVSGTREPIIRPPADPFDELAFIKGMEKDFAIQAESLLETLNLSHLRATAQKHA